MKRLPRPGVDSNAALTALSINEHVGSFPQLQAHVAAIEQGYAQYAAVNGDARAIAAVPLPPAIGNFLKGHYASPPKDIAFIDDMRRQGGVKACPMCGSKMAGTLDHFMPQTSHPEFAIFGLNLVPACKCNSLKGAALTGPNAGERILHPYFDDVLGERILSARFDDLGPVPSISLRVLIDAHDPAYPAISFHVRSLVERTQVEDYVRRVWVMLIGRPSRLTTSLRKSPPSRAALVEILELELENRDEFYEGKNNWDSIAISGLLDNHVVDWLFAAFHRPGRGANGSLVP